MRGIIGQAKADYLERTRCFSFLAMVALSLFAAFWFVPRTDDGLVIMLLQPEVFIQGGNPSWIPVASAMGLVFFLPFIGFFYLRSAIIYDEKIGMEQLISSSSIGNLRYLLGKFISGACLLFSFAIIVISGSFFMMLWNFPGQFLSLRAFFSPFMFLLVTLPMCAALSVIFGSVRFLRGGLGSAIYIFGSMALIAVPTAIENPGLVLRSLDITAMSSFMDVISRTADELTGHPMDVIMFLAINSSDSGFQPTTQLIFDGLHYHISDYAVFGIMMIFVLVCVVISAPLYSASKNRIKMLPAVLKNTADSESITHRQLMPAYFPVLPTKKHMWMRGIVAELMLMLKGQSLIWYLVGITGIVLSIFIEITIVMSFITPFLMLWFINVFSRMGSREHQYDMLTIITTIPGGKLKQVIYSWIAGLLTAALLALPVMIRLLATGRLDSVFAVFAGVVFLPSTALLLGEFTRTNRVFEMLFIFITYMIVNGMPFAMYMGHPTDFSLIQTISYFVVAIVFGIAAICKR